MSDIPEPRANPDLLDQTAAETALISAARGGRLHHAWMLTGPAGIGKATLAFRFARWMFAGMPDGQGLALDPSHPAFRRVAAGSHPDLLTIEPGLMQGTRKRADVINVDAVTLIPRFMGLTAAESGWRVIVIDQADTMNAQAQNRVLKVLEEPPPRGILVLTTSNPGRLLPTILSRCRRLAMPPLPDETVQTLLGRYAPQVELFQRSTIAQMAHGSIGHALELASDEGAALAALAAEVLDAIPDLPPARFYAIADKLGRAEGAFTTFIDLLQNGLATATAAVARGRPDALGQRLAAYRSLEAWARVWHALGSLRDETERLNLDKRQAVVAGLSLLTSPPMDAP